LKLHLIDSDADVASALESAFSRFGEVEVRYGNLLALAEECVVSPANSFGFMDGSFDRELYLFFGPDIGSRVQDAINRRPEGRLPVGASVVVRTGHIRVPFLLVAPTVTLPEQADPTNAYRAMRAILRVARAESAFFSHVYCPGLATGVGSVTPSEAADQMARAYNDFTNDD
jgi:O-acetyl-ADP-ribose deacetylase (regulator of RNase III)